MESASPLPGGSGNLGTGPSAVVVSVSGGSHNITASSPDPSSQETVANSVKLTPSGGSPASKRQKLGVNLGSTFQPRATKQPMQQGQKSSQNPNLQVPIRELQGLTQDQQGQLLPRPHPCLQHGMISTPQHHQRRHLVQQGPNVRQPLDVGLCVNRLAQYMYHERHRPQDNAIQYWKNFVEEYYAPQAKIKWCLSPYGSTGNHAGGVFPQTDVDACRLCGFRSGKVFEASFQILPWLKKIKFDSGVKDEHFSLSEPCGHHLSSGMMALEYTKAVQESVYEQLRVVREGRLRILFSQELKILNWEFCAQPHKYFFHHRYIVPQINQLMQVVHNYEAAVTESGPSGISYQYLQYNCNMIVIAAERLRKSLDLQSFNEWGYSTSYLKFLKLYGSICGMEKLIAFSQQHEMRRLVNPQSNRMQSELFSAQNQTTTNQRTMNNDGNVHPAVGSHASGNLTGTRVLDNSGVTNAASLDNYQNMTKYFERPNSNFIYQDSPYSQAQPSILTNGAANDNSSPQEHCLQKSKANQPQQIEQMVKQLKDAQRSRQQQLGLPPNVNADVLPGAEVCNEGRVIGGLPARVNPGLPRSGMDMELAKPFHTVREVSDMTNCSAGSPNIMNKADDLVQFDDDIVQEFVRTGFFGDGPGDSIFH